MDSDTLKDNTNLLPHRHQQHDLFVCDVADAVLKDDMASMEHPFFSLSKKPDTNVRRYENGDRWLEVVPSVKGLATIYDKDILIYCISQLIAKMNEGETPSPEAVRLGVPLDCGQGSADPAQRLFSARKTYRAAGLRDRPEALRQAGQLEDFPGDAQAQMRVTIAGQRLPARHQAAGEGRPPSRLPRKP